MNATEERKCTDRHMWRGIECVDPECLLHGNHRACPDPDGRCVRGNDMNCPAILSEDK